MAINYEYYRTFYYVAKYQNLTLAAKFLYSSQPNVSRVISLLEREYGCRLLERSNRGVKLTPEGERLYAYVRPAVEQLKLAEASAAQLTDLQQGSVSIGVSDTALSEIVIPALNIYQEQYPLVEVRIESSRTRTSLKAVENSLFDFAVVAAAELAEESLDCMPIMELSDIMVCGKRLQFLTEQPRALAELSGYPTICVGVNSTYQSFFDGIYAREGLQFRPDIFSMNAAQTLLMVRSNLGIGFVPEVCAREDLESGKMFRIPLTTEIPKRYVFLVSRKNSPLSVAASALRDVILSVASG